MNLSDPVLLSIIIPTFNRADRLKRCLESLANQSRSARDFEVIIVVDGSTDRTREILRSLRFPFRMRVIYQANAGQAAARNRGLQDACGRYCLFLDDDMVASYDLVAQHLRAHQSNRNVVAIGRIVLDLPPDADWLVRSFAEGWRDHYEQLDSGSRKPNWEDCYSGNLSVERNRLLDIGGFATDLPYGEDVELGYRLQRQGCEVVYLRGAASTQEERKGFGELVRDAESAGKAGVQLLQRYRAMTPVVAGSFQIQDLRKLLLRRLLLAFHVSPRLLGVAGWMIPHKGWQAIWGRFLHSYCYWRGVRRGTRDRSRWRRLILGTPILMYHAFGQKDESASRYVMPIRRFAWQMLLLKIQGYHVLYLETYVRYLQSGQLPPSPSVVITIDDGYACSHRLALPVLRRFNFPATLFLVSDKVGGVNDWDGEGELRSRRLLNWQEVQELVHGGVQIGAHTNSHLSLPNLSCKQLRRELEESRTTLEARLQTPVSLFAYPYGEYDPVVQRAVARAGFAAGCTVDGGVNTPVTSPYALRRVEIRGTDSMLHFLFALWFGETHPRLLRRREVVDVHL